MRCRISLSPLFLPCHVLCDLVYNFNNNNAGGIGALGDLLSFLYIENQEKSTQNNNILSHVILHCIKTWVFQNAMYQMFFLSTLIFRFSSYIKCSWFSLTRWHNVKLHVWFIRFTLIEPYSVFVTMLSPGFSFRRHSAKLQGISRLFIGHTEMRMKFNTMSTL